MLEKFALIIGVTSFLLNPYVKTLTYFPQYKTPLFSQCEQYSGHIDRFEGKDAIILLEDIGDELIIHKTKLPPLSKENIILNVERFGENWLLFSIDWQQTRERIDMIKQLNRNR